jgi:uncharacterized protein (TIGR00251 family)
MIKYTEKDGTLIFQVRVVPRASRSELVGEHDGALRVRIAAPPVDGAANDELLRLLARAFDVPLSAVDITGGHAAKLKTVCVAGGRAAILKSVVQSPSPKSKAHVQAGVNNQLTDTSPEEPGNF